MSSKGRIVVIDDEPNSSDAIEQLLVEDGYEVVKAHDGAAGLQLLEEFDADIVLTDLRMPDIDGLEVLARAKETRPDAAVILMTAFGTVKTAVLAIQRGADDYLAKPFQLEDLQLAVRRAMEHKQLRLETQHLRERLDHKYRFDNLVGESPEMLAAFKTVRQVAASSSSVLLVGESGTGKELFAQALHQNSPRRSRPFVKVACAALPETLLESELFGHEKGSFTGALFTRTGRFELAHGGTLFLDEIGDISPTVQVKLLRFLELREFERVGGNKTFKVDVRIVAATHRDLSKRIAEGVFREDLYYRMNVIQIAIPPLRERGNDIALLAHHFIHKYAEANGKEVRGLSDAALGMLLRHSWPGNVRELENAIERAVVLADLPTLCEAQFPTLPRPVPAAPRVHAPRAQIPGSTLDELERDAILRTLEAVNGSTSRAAAMLGISPRKVQYKVKEYQRAGVIFKRPRTQAPQEAEPAASHH